jgi:hypothetical protein
MKDESPDEQVVDNTLKQDLLPKRDEDLPIDVGLRHCTKALFYEFRHQSTCDIPAPYCLKDYDYEYGGTVYTSMYMIYMTCDSEYEAAIKLLGSYSHWKKLTSTVWFAPHLERWEAERNTRDEAIARSTLVKLAEAGNVTAARTIYTNSKAGATAGRPSKKGKRKEDSSAEDLEAMFDRADNVDT